MYINITRDLVADLATYNTRADQTAIALTPTGWQIEVDPDRTPPRSAITLDGVHAYADGELGTLTDDDFDAIATDRDYRIPDEHGDHTSPPEDADPRVVLPVGENTDGEDWEGAWWFDLNTAREVVAADHTEWVFHSARRLDALLVTASGQLVRRVGSNWQGEFGETWTEISETEAAEWMYQADPDLIAEGGLPPLLAAARTARQLVDLLAAPEALDAAEQAVSDTAVIGTLLRERVLADIRTARVSSARVVVAAEGGNVSAAARRLGIAQQTLAQLIR